MSIERVAGHTRPLASFDHAHASAHVLDYLQVVLAREALVMGFMRALYHLWQWIILKISWS